MLARRLHEGIPGLTLTCAAMAIAVYLQRRPWIVAGGWAVATAAVAVAYPATRGALHL